MSMRRRLRDGLVAAWSPAVSRTTGQQLLDVSGNGRHANSFTTFNPDTQYSSLNSYESIYRETATENGLFRAAGFASISETFTILAFGETSITTGSRNLFHLGVNNNNNPHFGLAASGTSALFYTNGMANITTSGVESGKFQLYAFVQDSETRRRTYFNTTETVNTTSLTGRTFTQANFLHFAINGTGSGDRWQGFACDFRVYERALSAGEIKALHEYGPGYGLRPEPTRVYFGGTLAEPPTPTFKPYWRQTPQLSTAGVIG
jgi:hypothetical protein